MCELVDGCEFGDGDGGGTVVCVLVDGCEFGDGDGCGTVARKDGHNDGCGTVFCELVDGCGTVAVTCVFGDDDGCGTACVNCCTGGRDWIKPIMSILSCVLHKNTFIKHLNINLIFSLTFCAQVLGLKILISRQTQKFLEPSLHRIHFLLRRLIFPCIGCIADEAAKFGSSPCRL